MNEAILTGELRKALISRLRDLEPWMRFDAVHEIVDNCGKLLEDEVQKQRPTIFAAKGRLGFLRLPAELRTRIYELSIIPYKGQERSAIELDASLANLEPQDLRVSGMQRLAIHLGSDREFDPVRKNADFHACCQPRETPKWSAQTPITKVCRQVRNETLPIYYSNEFIVHVWDNFIHRRGGNGVEFPEALRWLRAIGPLNRKLLKTLSLQGGTLNYRWVSAKRFLAVMKKEGIDDIPEGVVRSFYLHNVVNSFGRPDTQWSLASEEMEELHSQFGDEPEKM